MRWIFRLIGAVLIALVVATGGLFLLPQDKIARIAADQLSAQTGRKVTLSGEVHLSFWPILGVSTGPVQIANADWAGPEPMLSAQSLSIGVAAADLLRGDIRVTEVLADQPDLRLQRRADGQVNWEFGASTDPGAGAVPGPAGGTSSARKITLERLHLRDARLFYQQAGMTPVQYSAVDLTLDWPAPERVANLSLSFAPAGERLNIAAQIAGFADFLDGGVARVTTEISAPGGTASFVGRASTTGAAAGHLTIKASDVMRMVRGAGLAVPDLPVGLGRTADLVAEVTYTADGRLSMRGITATLDRNRLTGAMDMVFADRPTLTARLAAGALDLRALDAPSSGGRASGQSTTGGWSTEPIDASALAAADLSISLSAESIKTSTTQLGPTRVLFSIDHARAVLDVVHSQAFGGVLSGQLVANNRKGLSVGGRLKATDIDMSRALSDLAGFTRLSGKAAVELQFLSVGQSEAALMNALSGEGRFDMAQGVIAGLDLDALMSHGTAEGGTTVFDTLSASFVIANGTLTNDDLALSLPNYRADGAGRVGIGARDMDYLFTPQALRARGGEGLAIPIRVRGPWSNLKILPDLEAVLKARADVKLDVLEQDARDKIKAKLASELNAPVETRADVEEAVKDRVEDAARKSLLKLLGKN